MKKFLAGFLALTLLVGSALAADWPQFLGQEGSYGLNDSYGPTSAAQLRHRWTLATSGEGSDGKQNWTDVPGTPIAVGDYIYYYSSQFLRKVELSSGKEVAKARVYAKSQNQFFCNIAYAEGMIFVPCQKNDMDDGTGVTGCFIRVFDADTMQQLYVTEKIAGGQMQSPIMYHDGYIFTGTYGRNNVYAAFSVADEDPANDREVKKAAWTVPSGNSYGFSFNGAGFLGNSCYFTSGSTLFVVDYKTGESRTYDLGEGYVGHSTVTYASETERLYVSANDPDGGAAVFSFDVDESGMPVAETALVWHSGTENGGTQSTPVLYRGRLYIGGGGGTMGSTEPFHVVDAATMTEIYSVPIQSKGSAAVSTAYATAENNWQVYIYMVPYAPVDDSAQLWIIKDRQGQTEGDYEIVEGVGRAQYCSQSVLLADDGSLVWYNDGGALYCYENADAPQETFKDIRSHAAKEDILYLYEQGIVNGVGNGRFNPEGSLSRAEFAQMLAKLAGAELTAPEEQKFSDVAAGDWFAPAVAWAAESGLTQGIGEGKFGPKNVLTRQEVLVFAQRFVQEIVGVDLPEVQENVPFADSAELTWAAQAVEQGQRWGLLPADGSSFAPTAPATRAFAAQVVAELCRAMKG